MEKQSARVIATKFVKLLKSQNPNYDYLRDVFKFIRQDLNVAVTLKPKRLPAVPTTDEIKQFYKTVWESTEMIHVVIIKILLYTGVRVSELVNIKITDVNLTDCRIKINQGKGKKDRVVPFPINFKETLALHINQYIENNREYLFESSFRKSYTDRGIRKILMRYTKLAGIKNSISPHKLRHFLFTWLKGQNIDDALIQPFSGHSKRDSLEVYSRLSLADAQHKYNSVINSFPV